MADRSSDKSSGGWDDRESAQEKVNQTLTFAKEFSPYYRDKLKGYDLSKFEKIPFLIKDDIYRNTPPEGTEILTAPLSRAYVFASGGSTGAPKFCYYRYDEFDYVCSILADIYRIAGISSEDVVGNLFMPGNLWTSFLAATKALEIIGCVSLPIGGNADIDLMRKYLHLFRPTVLLGIPSIILELAEHIEKERDSPPPVSTILYGGEHLSGDTGKLLKSVFGAGVIRSAGYASVDAGPIGYQCPCCPGSTHHLLHGYQYLEIIDPESGKRLPPGEKGEIVVTNLHRQLMPLIRYRTGDLGRMVNDQCPCGSSDSLFELLERCDDVIRVGAVSIYPDEIGSVIETKEGFGRIFQIMAKREGRKDQLIVNVEEYENCENRSFFAESLRSAVLKRNPELKLALDSGWLGDFRVEVVPRGAIPRIKRTGKVRRVVDLRES